MASTEAAREKMEKAGWTVRGILETLTSRRGRRGAGGANAPGRSWARQIAAEQDLPARYAPFFSGLPPAEKQPFPYTVLTPTFEGIYRKPEPEKLVCFRQSAQIDILESVQDGFAHTCFQLADIAYVETGLVLLYSWITIWGGIQGDSRRSSTLKFNTVSDHVMAPLVKGLRSLPPARGEDDPTDERMRLDPLASLDFKLMSHAQRSIAPGEKIAQFVYQREIPTGRFGFAGLSLGRRLSPAHLTILTDCELILIRDDDTQGEQGRSRYGAIRTYLPLRNIESADLIAQNNGLVALHIHLRGKREISSIFEASKKEELECLMSKVRVDTLPTQPQTGRV